MNYITITIIIVVAVILLIMFFAYNNREVALRKEAEAQNKNIAGIHDAVWKIIKEKAGVAEKYRETFEKVYPEMIAGRYANDTALRYYLCHLGDVCGRFEQFYLDFTRIATAYPHCFPKDSHIGFYTEKLVLLICYAVNDGSHFAIMRPCVYSAIKL